MRISYSGTSHLELSVHLSQCLLPVSLSQNYLSISPNAYSLSPSVRTVCPSQPMPSSVSLSQNCLSISPNAFLCLLQSELLVHLSQCLPLSPLVRTVCPSQSTPPSCVAPSCVFRHTVACSCRNMVLSNSVSFVYEHGHRNCGIYT